MENQRVYGNAGVPDLASKGTQALVGRLAVAAATGALPVPSLGAPTLSPGAEVAAYSARLAALRVALHASADAAMRAACLPENPDKYPSVHATLPLAPPAVARQTHLSPEGGEDRECPAYPTLPYPAAGMEAVLGALVGAWEEVKAAEEARAAEEAAEFRSKTREAAGASEEVGMHVSPAGWGFLGQGIGRDKVKHAHQPMKVKTRRLDTCLDGVCLDCAGQAV